MWCTPLLRQGSSLHCIVITATMNVYTHIGFDDEEELHKMEAFRKRRRRLRRRRKSLYQDECSKQLNNDKGS